MIQARLRISNEFFPRPLGDCRNFPVVHGPQLSRPVNSIFEFALRKGPSLGGQASGGRTYLTFGWRHAMS